MSLSRKDHKTLARPLMLPSPETLYQYIRGVGIYCPDGPLSGPAPPNSMSCMHICKCRFSSSHIKTPQTDDINFNTFLNINKYLTPNIIISACNPHLKLFCILSQYCVFPILVSHLPHSSLVGASLRSVAAKLCTQPRLLPSPSDAAKPTRVS